MKPGKITRVALYYVVALVGLMLIYAVLYRGFMMRFEGRERTLLQSLQIVVQTMTTVGYGEDAPWFSREMHMLVIAMQLTGVVALFTLFPLLVLPWVEERLRRRWIPTQAPASMRDHAIICGHSPLTEELAAALTEAGRPVLLLVRDPDLATRLAGTYRTMHGDASLREDLQQAKADRASAIVLNESDERNAAIALTAAFFPGLEIIAVAQSSESARYLTYAGAHTVVPVHDTLAAALADKALTGTPFHLADIVHVAPGLDVAELPVTPGSPLAGKTLREARIGEQTGARVIGVWIRGEFTFSPGPGTHIDDGCVLVAAGSMEQLAALEALTLSSRWRNAESDGARVAILGCGEVAQAIHKVLDMHGVQTVLLAGDRACREGGRALSTAELLEGGIRDVMTVVIAIEDEVVATYAVLMARSISPQVQIVACASQEDLARRMRQAGAHYALSLASVGARAVAAKLLKRDLLAPGKQIRIERVPVPPAIAGRTVGESRIRSRTGCTVLAVERDEVAKVDISPGTRLLKGDTLILSGSDAHLEAFRREFRLSQRAG